MWVGLIAVWVESSSGGAGPSWIPQRRLAGTAMSGGGGGEGALPWNSEGPLPQNEPHKDPKPKCQPHGDPITTP